MNAPIDSLKAALGKAFRVLKAADEAIDYRYEDYAQQRFDRLERRVAALESARPESSLPFPTPTGRTNP